MKKQIKKGESHDSPFFICFFGMAHAIYLCSKKVQAGIYFSIKILLISY